MPSPDPIGEPIGEKWGIDETRLVAKLQQMPKSTLIAVQEVCEQVLVTHRRANGKSTHDRWRQSAHLGLRPFPSDGPQSRRVDAEH
jgi:hypothetical protein